ncbi:TPA: hypothetical protein NJY85_004567 [Vibrio parahaemolyticus]|nr:VPA1267 family protein [Vibrio parahaemolyticus]HCG5131728.1 hypothetical protein [Vibrio parahaemolyticus]
MSDFGLTEDTDKKLSSGDKNASKFEAWLSSKIPLDTNGCKIYNSKTWLPLVNAKTHNLARAELSAQSGVGLSALRQNPKIKALLEELETALREKNILPALTESGKVAQDSPRKYDQGASQRHVDTNRLRELEEENQRLRAELKRFEELKEIMSEMGMGVEL